MNDTAPAMLPRPYRVAAIRWELPDTYTLDLEPDDGPAMAFAPGQIAMLYVFGTGEVPISISSAHTTHSHVSLTIRASGFVTKAGARLTEGSQVGLRGPFGVPWPLDLAERRDVVIVAGGIGLAPLRSVIYAIAADPEAYGTPSITYGSRDPGSLLYRDELETWRSGAFHVEITVDRAASDWRGDVGLVSHLLPRVPFRPDQAIAMVCGPEIMMRVVGRELTQLGMPADRIFLTMERNMKCGIGLCGHCQLGPMFLCKDGPVFPLAAVDWLMDVEAW